MSSIEKINKLTGKNLTFLIILGLLKKVVWVVLLFSTSLLAQKENKFIRQGNNNYFENNYKDAEVDYMKALEKAPESSKGQYNLGTALYKQENFEDASKLFGSVTGSDLDKEAKASAFHNMGNAFMKEQKLEEAIESYKHALRINPDDMDTKYNLAYAQNMMEQQQQEQDQQQDQENEDQEDKEDQQKDQKEQDQEDQQEQQDKQNQQDQQNQQQNQQQPQPQQISKQDAERMLEALKNDENKTLEKVKLQQVPAKSKSSEKDW